MLNIRRTGAADYGKYINLLVCGEPGAGKTLLSSTFPNPLYASAEGGLMSIADRNIPYLEIRDTRELLSLKNSLNQEPAVIEQMLGFPVETIVIDTIDAVQQILIQERLKSEKKAAMAIQDWGWVGEQMKALITGLRNLDMNVVFTCHLKETNDDDGKVWYKPGLQGGISDQIPGLVDLSLVLDSVTDSKIVDGELVKRNRRVLLTTRSPKFPFIKDRSGKLPSEFDVNFDDDYARMHELVYAGVAALPEGSSVEVEEVPVVTLAPIPETPVDVAPAKPKASGVKVKETPVETAPEPTVTPEPEVTPEPAPEAATEAPEPSAQEGPRNTLPEGVVPRVVEGYDTNIFCVECGSEVEDVDQAQISRIRYRRILDRPCFEKAAR